MTGAIYHNKNRADKTAYAKVFLEDNEVLQRNVVTLKEGRNDWKTVKCGKGVEKWREICKSSDEANEERNQWIW